MPFEPSKETKEYYLYTKKKPLSEGGFVHPGLFSSRYILPYSLLFFFAIVLEFYGMFMLYQAGNFHYGFAVLLVMLDLLFAFGSHYFQKPIKEGDIELALSDDEIQSEQLRRKQIRPKLFKGLLLTLIAILGIGKMIFFWGFYQHFDALVLMIITTYAVVALIHINVTGYTIFEFWRYFNNNRDYNKYIKMYTAKNKQEFKARRHVFESKESVVPCDNNGHKVFFDDTIGKYVIETYGMFMDDDLKGLVNQQQSPDTKYKVAREGLHHQYFSILNAEPIYESNSIE